MQIRFVLEKYNIACQRVVYYYADPISSLDDIFCEMLLKRKEWHIIIKEYKNYKSSAIFVVRLPPTTYLLFFLDNNSVKSVIL